MPACLPVPTRMGVKSRMPRSPLLRKPQCLKVHLVCLEQDRNLAIRRKTRKIYNDPLVRFQCCSQGAAISQVGIYDYAGYVKNWPSGPINDDHPELWTERVRAQLDFYVLGLTTPLLVYAPLSFVELLVEKLVTPVFPGSVCRELKPENVELDEGSDTG